MTAELWNTDRCRAELNAASIRSVSVLLARKGIEAVAREPGRVGMNLYPAAAVRAAFHLGEGSQDQGADRGATFG